MLDLLIDIALPNSSRRMSIATLGPTGTSSEAAAAALHAYLNGTAAVWPNATQLHDSYESAGQAVLDGEADLLLVANAYADIARFYMNPALDLAAAFIRDTPQYGIAAVPGVELPSEVRVASHPAPVPLISQLMPKDLAVREVIQVLSTSTAAAMAKSREVDVALTTEPAALLNKLRFISRTRPIRMLWSVFAGSTAAPAT